MKKIIYATFVVFIFFFGGIDNLVAQSLDDYRTIASGNWTDPTIWERYDGANWVPAVTAPTAATANVITVRASHAVFAGGITIDQTIVEAGAFVNQTWNVVLNNGTGDDLQINGTWTLNAPSAKLYGANATVTVNGSFNHHRGTMGDYNTPLLFVNISPTGTLHYQTPDNINIERAQLTNNGTINWNLGWLVINQTVNNDTCKLINNGTWNISSSALDPLHMYGDNNTYVINTAGGTINKTGSGSIITQQGTYFINEGVLNVINGTFSTNNQNASFHNYGTINIASSGTFHAAWNVNLYNGSIINGDGYFNVVGIVKAISGNVTYDNQVKLNLESNGYLTGAGLHTVNCIMNWTNGQIGAPNSIYNGLSRVVISPSGVLGLHNSGDKILERAQLTNNGTIFWSDGNLFINQTVNTDTCKFINNGTWYINTGGVVNIYGQNNTYVINTANGVINKAAIGHIITEQGTYFINEGTINVYDGYFSTNNQNASFHNYGNINVEWPGQFDAAWNVNLYNGSTVTGNGNFNVTGMVKAVSGNVTYGNNVKLNLQLNGYLTGAGLHTINGTMNWTLGQIGAPNYIHNGLSRVEIAANGTLNITGIGNKILERAQLTNNGTINWNGGSLYTNQTVNADTCKLINNGTWNINNGAADLWGQANTYYVNGAGGTIIKNSTGTNTIQYNAAFVNEGLLKGVGTLVIDPQAGYQNSGTISPGFAVGELTINGQNPFTPTSELLIELNDATGPGVGHDLLKRGGVNVILNGRLTAVENNNLPNGTYTIIEVTGGTVSGSFSQLNLPPGYSVGTSDSTVYLIKAQTYYTSINDTICNGQSYPFGNQMLTNSGTYHDTLVAQDGADSIVTLNLHIETVTATVTQSGNTLTAGPAGYQYQWIDCNTYQPIAGAVAQSFTPTQAGNYAVIVTSPNGCVDTSACSNVTIVGVDEIVELKEWKIYPNPSSDAFTILAAQSSEFELYDVTGKMLDTFFVIANERFTYHHTLPKGVYVLRGKESGVMRKIIVH